MYPEPLVAPMRAELTSIGVKELKTADEVVEAIEKNSGTTLLVINSVCGCAAGAARPSIKLALAHPKKPDHAVTVFAGVDKDAVAKARNYLLPFPPSSPCIALIKDGKLVHMIERHHIEGASPLMIAENLSEAFNEYC